MNYIKIIIAIVAVFYFLSVYFVITKNKFKAVTIAASVIGNVSIVSYNWIINGYVPFVSMFQVLTFLGVCFPLTYLFIRYALKNDISIAWFLICSGVCMVGCLFMNSSLIWHQPPALQSIWFLPHVLCYMLSYSLCSVAFVLTIVMMCKKDKKEKEHIEKFIYNIVLTSFPFMTMGLMLGAVWANEIWGGYWAWDPKENWALVTWCLYALYFHCRKHKDLKKYITVILFIAFLCLLMTFIGINLFNLGTVHSYS